MIHDRPRLGGGGEMESDGLPGGVSGASVWVLSDPGDSSISGNSELDMDVSLFLRSG